MKMDLPPAPTRWYRGIGTYPWLVLFIASLGWVFDVFEGQLIVACRNEMLMDLLPPGASAGEREYAVKLAYAAFLFGGALGGIVFGILSDKIGRVKTMILTILAYSLFTGLTAFAKTWGQMTALRFLVAMGTGGEWAVGSALVAEVFPIRSRAWSLAIFHGSSVLGTYLAVFAGAFIVAHPNLGWRWAYALGALPALMTLWIRWRLREPEAWVKARDDRSRRAGRLSELFSPGLRRRTIVGLGLATVGLVTFWGVYVYGKELAVRNAKAHGLSAAEVKSAEMTAMFLVTTGGGLGLVAFGPISERLKRRGAFLFYHLGALGASVLLFTVLRDAHGPPLWAALPVFGFLSLGMHAGYAVYFPELFPTRVRATGAGFCFNGARLLAALIMLGVGAVEKDRNLNFTETAPWLSLLFIAGALILPAAPETKGTELPE